MSSPKLRVIFRPKSEIQTFFLPKIRWSPKKKKKKKRSSPKLRLIFRPKSEIQTFFLPKIRWSPKKKKKKKKKKKVFTKIETDFSAGFVTFRSVGGDASRNGAELYKIRADFSAQIVTFRLVGGDASPPSPPLNPPLITISLPKSTQNQEHPCRLFTLDRDLQAEKSVLEYDSTTLKCHYVLC